MLYTSIIIYILFDEIPESPPMAAMAQLERKEAGRPHILRPGQFAGLILLYPVFQWGYHVTSN